MAPPQLSRWKALVAGAVADPEGALRRQQFVRDDLPVFAVLGPEQR